MKNKKVIGYMLSYIILSVMLVVTVFPIFYTITASFKSNMEIMTMMDKILPVEPTLANYKIAWGSRDFQVGILLLNSVVYTLVVTASTILVASMAGYVFARGNFPFKKTIFACFAALMFIKTGGIDIYATFEVLNFLNIERSLWSLMLIKLFAVPIVNIYLVKGYISTLPKALDEAAEIDGCGFIAIFFKIIAPLLQPILATVGILAFQSAWNEYLLPAIFTISEPTQKTLIVGLMSLKSSSGAATSWNLMLAGSTIALIPVLIAFAFGNKYFVSGLTSGAVKG